MVICYRESIYVEPSDDRHFTTGANDGGCQQMMIFAAFSKLLDGGCRFCRWVFLSCFGMECEYVARCPVVVHRHLCSSGAVLKYVLPPVLTLCLSYKYKNLQVEIRH